MATKPLLSTKSKEEKEAGNATTNEVDTFDFPIEYNYIKFISRVKHCANDGENIDIYQFLAFKWNTGSGFDIWRLTHEVLMCILAQMIGVVVILKQVIEDGVDVKDSCNDSPIQLKLLAFALSSVAGYVAMEVFMHEKGMYTGGIADCCSKSEKTGSRSMNTEVLDINFAPPYWVSLFWLGVGTWVNRTVSIGAVGGSFMVIFFSENAFDMVLNSVALFFLMELDDMLMTQPKYNEMSKHLKKWPEEIHDMTKKEIEIYFKQYKGPEDFFDLARHTDIFDENLTCCNCILAIAHIFNVCCFCCYAFFGVFFVIACVVVPVYIGVCY